MYLQFLHPFPQQTSISFSEYSFGKHTTRLYIKIPDISVFKLLYVFVHIVGVSFITNFSRTIDCSSCLSIYC